MNRLLIYSLSVCLVGFVSCRKEGCTDELARNYSSEANYDNGSCNYIKGCIDSAAVNYDPEAALSDESCLSFENWRNWILVDIITGPDSLLGFAHLGNDSFSVRSVYANQELVLVNGQYQPATMIVKHSAVQGSAVDDEYVGMLKLEKGEAPTSNDWEWFLLNRKGYILRDNSGVQQRGPELLNNYCTNCHSIAANDFVFTN